MRIGNSKYWLFQAIGWGSFALINAFFAFSFDRLTPDFFKRLGVFLVLGLIFSHLMRMAIIRFGLLQKSLNKQIFQFFIITFCLAILVSYLSVEALIYFDLIKQDEVLLLERTDVSYWVSKLLLVLSSAFSYFILFFIWSLIYFVYHYVAKSRKQQLDTLQLESLVKELELKTIKAHINPHFIFNSLNSIRALVDENPERARKAITELSNILRSSMQADKSEAVPFQKELFIVKDYLALENMRFEDRLKIEYNVDEDTLSLPVPPMMLQTLVENAIKHGISKQILGGVVRVISTIKDNFHELSVQNTGYLNGHVTGEGFGLSSTTNRLNLLYGNKAKFEIRQASPGLVEATVMIPVGDDY
ncbi:MAG TPA: histidine kinase [Chitinophagaceae bacterium]|nr:histidine kinase [Chitinophagaceae bacterium]HUM64937.1 histidine kinase [Chitinophagaceae bacterium]